MGHGSIGQRSAQALRRSLFAGGVRTLAGAPETPGDSTRALAQSFDASARTGRGHGNTRRLEARGQAALLGRQRWRRCRSSRSDRGRSRSGEPGLQRVPPEATDRSGRVGQNTRSRGARALGAELRSAVWAMEHVSNVPRTGSSCGSLVCRRAEAPHPPFGRPAPPDRRRYHDAAFRSVALRPELRARRLRHFGPTQRHAARPAGARSWQRSTLDPRAQTHGSPESPDRSGSRTVTLELLESLIDIAARAAEVVREVYARDFTVTY